MIRRVLTTYNTWAVVAANRWRTRTTSRRFCRPRRPLPVLNPGDPQALSVAQSSRHVEVVDVFRLPPAGVAGDHGRREGGLAQLGVVSSAHRRAPGRRSYNRCPKIEVPQLALVRARGLAQDAADLASVHVHRITPTGSGAGVDVRRGAGGRGFVRHHAPLRRPGRHAYLQHAPRRSRTAPRVDVVVVRQPRPPRHRRRRRRLGGNGCAWPVTVGLGGPRTQASRRRPVDGLERSPSGDSSCRSSETWLALGLHEPGAAGVRGGSRPRRPPA